MGSWAKRSANFIPDFLNGWDVAIDSLLADFCKLGSVWDRRLKRIRMRSPKKTVYPVRTEHLENEDDWPLRGSFVLILILRNLKREN